MPILLATLGWMKGEKRSRLGKLAFTPKGSPLKDAGASSKQQGTSGEVEGRYLMLV